MPFNGLVGEGVNVIAAMKDKSGHFCFLETPPHSDDYQSAI